MLICIKNYLRLDIDECAIKTDNCNAYQCCNNTEGSFICIYRNGSNGKNLSSKDSWTTEHLIFKMVTNTWGVSLKDPLRIQNGRPNTEEEHLIFKMATNTWGANL